MDVMNVNIEVRVRDFFDSRVVEHGGDDDSLFLHDTIADARQSRPIGQLAARGKHPFRLEGANEVAAVEVQQLDVVKEVSRARIAVLIDQARLVCNVPRVKWHPYGRERRAHVLRPWRHAERSHTDDEDAGARVVPKFDARLSTLRWMSVMLMMLRGDRVHPGHNGDAD